MRRILCVWFPNWTIQRWRQTDPSLRSAALVVSAEFAGRGRRVTACCPHASRAGVLPGMPLAEARALLPSPSKTPGRTCWKNADPAADHQALRQIAIDGQRYTPLTGMDEFGRESILLDITGCAELFGGERNLLQTVMRDLSNRGFQIRTALADGIGTAWAVAHYGQSATIISSGHEQQALEPLPTASLRLSAKVVESLERLAIHTVEDLLRLPRSSLTSRFGPELLQRLNQAFGVTWESFPPERLATPLVAQWSADDPLTDQRELVFVFRQLLTEILRQLVPQHAGLLELHCELRTEAETVTLPLQLAEPAHELRHIVQLFELTCERQQFPGGIFSFRLKAARIGSIHERQTTLLDDERDRHDREIRRLVERLSSRLGPQAVLRPVAVADPLPERALRLVPWLTDSPDHSAKAYVPSAECRSSRPWRVLPAPQPVQVMAAVPAGPPRRLTWQGRTWDIHQTWGPERIESGWWRTWDVQRDYYRVETSDGSQFWLFRDARRSRWFLHGLFD